MCKTHLSSALFANIVIGIITDLFVLQNDCINSIGKLFLQVFLNVENIEMFEATKNTQVKKINNPSFLTNPTLNSHAFIYFSYVYSNSY